MRALVLLVAWLATPVLGHEYWLRPLAYQVPADGMLVADIVNGEGFEGHRLPYLPSRLLAYDLRLGDIATAVTMRPGDRPALAIAAPGEGLAIVTQVTKPAPLDYDEFDQFLRFAAHKDLLGGVAAVTAAHEARGLPRGALREVYGRFSKTLIAVGSGAGADARVGLAAEFVALANPYRDDLSGGLPVALYQDAEPLADIQVQIFDRAPDGTVEVTTTRTDGAGQALIPVAAGHEYMLDAVLLRVPSEALAAETGAVWETLWANLTFAVP